MTVASLKSGSLSPFAYRFARAGRVPKAALTRHVERVLSIPSEIALRAMNSPLLERARGRTGHVHRRPMRNDGWTAPVLDAPSAAIVAALDRDGAFATSLDDLALPSTGAMFEAANVLSQRLGERSQRPDLKDRAIVSATADDLMTWPAVFHWGLNERLLDIVEVYLGQRCAYDGVAHYYSRADGREISTRVWHRDREDVRTVKVAIYVNDVGQDGGPFEILDPQYQRVLDAQLSWRYAAINHARLIAAVGPDAAARAVRTFTGLRGTVVLVDTARCHHRGKPPVRFDRSAIFYSYFSRSPRHPFFCERSTLRRPHLHQLAHDLPQRARDCVLWRDALPLTSRLIPRSYLTV